jgi:regulatory protein
MLKTKKMSFSEALQRLMDLCSRSEKSSSDILKKLREWKLEEEADNIIKLLREDLFLDDARYASAFAADKIKLNKWGIIKIRYLLKSRQIMSSDIEKAIIQIDMNNYHQMVFSELSIKKNTLKSKDPYIVKNKLYAFGNQRGYESNLINEFIESIELT